MHSVNRSTSPSGTPSLQPRQGGQPRPVAPVRVSQNHPSSDLSEAIASRQPSTSSVDTTANQRPRQSVKDRIRQFEANSDSALPTPTTIPSGRSSVIGAARKTAPALPARGGLAPRLPTPVASQQPSAELAAPVTTPSTTPSTDVAPAATHQAIAPSEAAVATPTVEIELQTKPKSGMDKAWYPHPTNPDVGWLQVHNPGKSGVMKKELETIEALAKLNVPVARVIAGEAPPKSISVLGMPVDVNGDGGGAWLQKIDTQAQNKLKPLGGAFGGERLAALVASLREKGIDTEALRGNLQALKTQIEAVLDHVGEVDVAFSKDGSITLLDVAPGEDGKAIGRDSDGGEDIKKGLDKLMAALGATGTTPHV